MKKINIIYLLLLFSSMQRSSAQLTITDPDHYSMWPYRAGKPDIKSVKLSTGIVLEYAEQGDATGIPVIFLHGVTDSWRSFESLLSHLTPGIHAFAVSLRGHGNSERPQTGYDMKDFANDIAAFIKDLNLSRPVVVGHSMSGLIVQQIALDHAAIIKGIVIIDSSPAFSNNPDKHEFLNMVLELEDPIAPSFVDEFQKSTLAKPIDPAYYSTLVSEGLKVPARVWKAAFEGLMEVNYITQLKNIKVPVLIVWGDKDSYCSRGDQNIFLTQIPHAKLIVYQGTGHALHWEEPKRFAADVLEFTRRVYVFNNR